MSTYSEEEIDNRCEKYTRYCEGNDDYKSNCVPIKSTVIGIWLLFGVDAFYEIIESVAMPNTITIVVIIVILVIAIKIVFGLLKILFPIALALLGIKLLLSSYVLSGLLLLFTAYGIGSFVYK